MRFDQVRVAATPRLSRSTVFDAVCAHLRRRGLKPEPDTSGRTLTVEIPDSIDLAWISGTHRVQRIPKGSSSRHTSTVTIAVLEGAGAVDALDPLDVEERFTRGTGPGGQHRNTSDTKVVVTHLPTGIQAQADERSQWQSRQKAWRELERRVRDASSTSAASATNDARCSQISSGERPVKSFTHNDQRDEVVDHQTGRKWRMSAWRKGRF